MPGTLRNAPALPGRSRKVWTLTPRDLWGAGRRTRLPGSTVRQQRSPPPDWADSGWRWPQTARQAHLQTAYLQTADLQTADLQTAYLQTAYLQTAARQRRVQISPSRAAVSAAAASVWVDRNPRSKWCRRRILRRRQTTLGIHRTSTQISRVMFYCVAIHNHIIRCSVVFQFFQ